MKLLTRDEFRNGVFQRDRYLCVNCSAPAQDAHHIIERRLFDDEGYYIDNGASLCGECHKLAEKTLLGAQVLRDIIGIQNIVLPKGFYRSDSYDKWGNILLPNGNRIKGELFFDESVQKVLKDVLHLFTPYVKYPRTKHVPWSLSVNKDDSVLKNMAHFEGRQVVVTEKMDGENASIYADGYFHARSLDGHEHPSQSWIKNYLHQFAHELPDGWRICGENLYAEHSIKYEALESYFYAFSIWEHSRCLSWDETEAYCELLGIQTVPVLYRGIYDEAQIKAVLKDESTSEGYVIRDADSFLYQDFKYAVAKYVRQNHIQENRQNWRMNWSGATNLLAGAKA